MKDYVVRRFEGLRFVSEINKKLESGEKLIPVSALPDTAKSLLVRYVYGKGKTVLLLLHDKQKVNEFCVELSILGFDENVIKITDLDLETLQEKLTGAADRDKVILISTYELINVKLPAKDELSKNTTKIEIGGDLAYDDLLEYLNLLEYEREKFVVEPGFYSVRGSIIDFWSYSEKQPARLEFDGDFIESIRYFDPDSQRSLENIPNVTLASKIDSVSQKFNSDIFDYLNNPVVFAAQSELNGLTLKKDVDEKITANDLDEELLEELFDGKPVEEQFDEFKVPVNEEKEFSFNEKAIWIVEDELGAFPGRIDSGLTNPPEFNANFKLLFSFLSDYAAKNFAIYITTENELQAKRLTDLLSDFNEELLELLESGKVKVEVLAIKTGFISKEARTVVLSDYQIFNKPYRTKLPSKRKYKKSSAKDLASLKRGDFVVHEKFGIGKYDGLETINIGPVEQESIKILYADNGVVYVNLNYLSLVKKYSSQDKAPPRLSKLGGSEWKTTKKKVKSKIKDAARELIKLYAQRKATKGIAYGPDTIWQKELEASFFYEPTIDQVTVTEEVKKDMESENPMDRLVCGDVGFGKTEIAVRAAFKAISNGKQVAMLVPTTILAEQHFNTFKDRLSMFPVRVEVLSRFIPKSKQNVIIKDLAGGKVDMLIGTHRLLSKDVKFKDLGLLIIDEEHRFGVMAKEKLRKLRVNVDTLTLTATPIPRTLNMSLLGARDLSIIATPPPNRQPIYTKVEKFDITKIRDWIIKEKNRGGQVYFVHDRVNSIDKLAAYVKKYIPEINVAVAHGQMKPSELEKVIHGFLAKKYDVLISTKIIESGLDIPNVNTIIINRADRFGLAELHQLRGRVGRSDRQAYAYLIVPSFNTITKKAVKRLQAIEEYTDLGEGFNISMRDLEIRGAGNLLGTEQSGAIDSVGFDMYVKLLDEAVNELKENEFADIFKDLPKQMERAETTVDTFYEINIPKNFMPDQSDRLSFYSALFSMLRIEEVDDIKEEMIDRFGKLPQVVERLIDTAVLRFYASLALFERVVITKRKISLVLPDGKKEEFYEKKFPALMELIMTEFNKTVRFTQNKDSMKLELDNNFSSVEETLEYVTAFCKRVLKLYERTETEENEPVKK